MLINSMYILKQCQKPSLSIDLPQLRVISFTVFNHQQLRYDWYRHIYIYTMVFWWLQHYILGIWHPQIKYISTQLYNKDYIQTELISRYSRWINRYLKMKQQYASFFSRLYREYVGDCLNPWIGTPHENQPWKCSTSYT